MNETEMTPYELFASYPDVMTVQQAREALGVGRPGIYKLIQSGKLRYAAVDVACIEPIPADSPLLSAPNCIITPHMAWAPAESRQRILDSTVRSIDAFLEGNPVNVVN